MIVAILNTKGGVGKSTLALNLAVSRAISGRDVWLVDGDRQATCLQAVAQRVELGAVPALAVTHLVDGPLLRAQVLQNCAKYDDVVIDAGGRDSTAIRAAMTIADVVVIPVSPRSVDIWAMDDMAKLVQEVLSMRDDLKVLAILNNADPRGTDNEDAANAIAAFEHITYLDAPIGRRKAFADAMGSGLGVVELRSKDEKACNEIAKLVNLVFIVN